MSCKQIVASIKVPTLVYIYIYIYIAAFVSFVCKVFTAPIPVPKHLPLALWHSRLSSRLYTWNYSYIEPSSGKRVDTTADVHCSHIYYMRKDNFSDSFQHQSNITSLFFSYCVKIVSGGWDVSFFFECYVTD